MRYEFEDVIIDTGDQFSLIDATTIGDSKRVLIIGPSQEAVDEKIMNDMREAKASQLRDYTVK